MEHRDLVVVQERLDRAGLQENRVLQELAVHQEHQVVVVRPVLADLQDQAEVVDLRVQVEAQVLQEVQVRVEHLDRAVLQVLQGLAEQVEVQGHQVLVEVVGHLVRQELVVHQVHQGLVVIHRQSVVGFGVRVYLQV